MTARALALPAPRQRAGAVKGAYRAELRKLLAQLSTRVLFLVCLLGPAAFAVVLSEQSGVPGDTLLGVWVHSSGYAVPFVVLGFAGYLGLPLLAGALAGDLFASEDRYGTWKTVLTRSRTRRDVFLGKVLAGGAAMVVLLAVAALSSLIAGLLLTGDQPLVGLSGTLIPSGEALWLVLASWALITLPALAFTSLALLFSVATRSGIVGVLAPVLIALAMQLLALIGRGSIVHALLLASAFDIWHGLLAAPRFYAPLLIAAGVSLLWLVACLGGSWLLLRRRDFAGPPVARRQGWVTPLRVVLGAAALLALLAAASDLGPVPVTSARLEASIGRTFSALTVLQQKELGRPVPDRAELDQRVVCRRRAGRSEGPGDDWTCTMTVIAPQASYNPLQLTPVTYDVGVKSDGCYKAEAPPSFVGQQTMTDARGRSVVNPLFIIYGCFDPTAAVHCPEVVRCAPAGTRASPAGPARGGRSTRTESTPHGVEPPPAVQHAAKEALRLEERKLGPARVREITEAEKKLAEEKVP
jgi:ABC-2 type transport system permease protein